jgi:very-short-patch-repair endonuclease
MTDAERRLWYLLRAHRFDGHKFKRQVPVGPYDVDFACLNRVPIVEVDGGQHAENANDGSATIGCVRAAFKSCDFGTMMS